MRHEQVKTSTSSDLVLLEAGRTTVRMRAKSREAQSASHTGVTRRRNDCKPLLQLRPRHAVQVAGGTLKARRAHAGIIMLHASCMARMVAVNVAVGRKRPGDSELARARARAPTAIACCSTHRWQTYARIGVMPARLMKVDVFGRSAAHATGTISRKVHAAAIDTMLRTFTSGEASIAVGNLPALSSPTGPTVAGADVKKSGQQTTMTPISRCDQSWRLGVSTFLPNAYTSASRHVTISIDTSA